MTFKQPGWKIYKQQMEPLNHGDALWEPASIYSCKRVELGDVGYIRRGRFHLLFSAGCPLGSRKLGVDVPLTFEPLDVGHIIFSQPRLPGYICTNSVKEIGEGLGASVAPAKFSEAGTTFSFELNEEQGAVLVTKHHTSREDIEFEYAFEEYTKRHYDSWVAFARNSHHGNDIKPVLVAGVDMTRDFAMMAYSNNHARLLSGFTTSSSSSVSAPAAPWGKWHTQGLVHTNCGPCSIQSPNTSNWSSVDAEQIDVTPSEYDQCVFVRYYTMRKRALMFPGAAKAGAGPHELGPRDNHAGILSGATMQSSLDSDAGLDCGEDSASDCASSVTLSESNFEVFHRVSPEEEDTFDLIAKYVFENSNAEAVLMHHRDIHQIREGMPETEISEILLRGQPKIAVGSDGVGKIAHRNSQQLAITLPGATSPSPVVTPLHVFSDQPSGISVCSNEEDAGIPGRGLSLPSLSCSNQAETPPTDGLENYPHSQHFQTLNPPLFQPADYLTAAPSQGFQFLAFPPRDPPFPPAFLGQSPQWDACEPIPSHWYNPLASAANSSIVVQESDATQNKPVSIGEGQWAVKKSDVGCESSSSSDDDGPGGVNMSSTHLTQLPLVLNPAPPTRLPGACTHCKKLKMKCVFPENENTCKRCKDGGHRCVVGRGRGVVLNKRELLMAQIKQKDEMIESLKKQLQNPCVATPSAIAQYQIPGPVSNEDTQGVVEWLESFNHNSQVTGGTMKSQPFTFATRSNHIASDTDLDGGDIPTTLGGKNARGDDEGAAADPNLRAPPIQQDPLPEIMAHGLVTPIDVEKLFSIFQTKLNPHVSLLDLSLHSPATTFSACPFLFTVVCAVSSRYYWEKPQIYPIAMHFARHAAASAFIDGQKSVEFCQAYILLSIYGVPAKCWEEDRNWLYAGLAIRIATDLNLFLPQPKEFADADQERRALNKTRTWLACHNLDHAITTQFRKPPSIKENQVVENSESWYKQSRFNGRYDIGLCAHTCLVRIVAKFREDLFPDPSVATGLDKAVDFKAVTQHHDDKLIMFNDEWKQKFSESDTREPSHTFRSSLLPFLVSYSRLGMHLFGFQHALEKRSEADLRHFYTKCFGAATSVVEIMVEDLAPSGFMLYSPDSHFVSTSLASVFLLKLLRPEFSWLVEPHDKAKILDLIERLIRTLDSPEVSIDDKHTPRLHARFLAGLLKKNHPDPGQDLPFQVPLPLSGGIAGGNPALYKGQPQPLSTQHSSSGPTQSASVLQGWAGDVSYPSNWNPFSQPDVPYATVNPRRELQPWDGGVDGTENPMSNPPDEDAAEAPRAAGSWWTGMVMPGFVWPGQD